MLSSLGSPTGFCLSLAFPPILLTRVIFQEYAPRYFPLYFSCTLLTPPSHSQASETTLRVIPKS